MILWSIGCLIMYFDMYSIGIKIPKRNEGQLLLVDDFVEHRLKLSLWQIWCLQQENYILNHFLWIRMLGLVFVNSKTHMVVMEVVSQHLDEYKNNCLIFNLQEILSGQIWACCLVWFLINHGFMLWLRKFYGID